MLANDNAPRLLSRSDLAGYLGLTPAGVSDWVTRGLIPPALPGTHRWDRMAVDKAIDKMSGLMPQSTSAYDDWKAAQCA